VFVSLGAIDTFVSEASGVAVSDAIVVAEVAALLGVTVISACVASTCGEGVSDALAATEVATGDPPPVLPDTVTVGVASGVLVRDKIIAKVMANARMPTAAIATMTSFPRSRCIYCPSVSNDVSIGKAK
jgi:hypothetical protein